MEDKFIDVNIDDALMERPFGFTIEDKSQHERHFLLYPVTLGKLHLLNRHMQNLEMKQENILLEPHMEVLRIVKIHRDEVCKIIAYHTFKRKRDLFDSELIKETTQYISENSSDEELASLFLYLITRDNVEAFKKHLGITKENDRMNRVVEYKKKAQKHQNDFSFGGKTTYGTLIDTACERYGWTYDYVMWGISFVNLQLMLADRIQSIYLTDDEKKHIPSSVINTGETINADTKEAQEKILQMNWK